MEKRGKLTDKLKGGMSVEEIENFARKYTSEVFFALSVIIASISSTFDFFTGPGWSLMLAGIAAVIAAIFPEQTGGLLIKFYQFVGKQEKMVQIVIGVLRIVLAIFLPLVTFTGLGFLAGVAYFDYTKKAHMHMHREGGASKSSENEEEHL